MSKLKIALLREFRVSDENGTEIPIAGKKQRGLIAYLALNTGRRIERDSLATLLWGDRIDTQARQSLRQALHLLRRIVDKYQPDALQTDDETVVLQANSEDIDVLRFEALIQNGKLEEAVDVYSGDLLDGLAVRSDAFDTWLAQERARLHDLACEAWEILSNQYLDDGRFEAAIDAGRHAVLFDPMRETGHRALMRALVGAGRRSEAIQQYHNLEDSLRSELNIAPDFETTQLFESIRIDGETAAQKSEQPSTAPNMSDGAVDQSTSDKVTKSGHLPLSVTRWAVLAAFAVAIVTALFFWNNQFRSRNSTAMAPGSERASLPLPDKPSIAVLPFKNMSGEPEQDYFADGITEDIITGLAKFELFLVISRNSISAYKGKNPNVKDVARELGARYVLEGSVRKFEDRVRINAQLIDATSDTHIWAELYDRQLKDVFKVQDELTNSIVTSVAPEYFSAELKRAQLIENRSLNAWDAFMRGYWHLLRYTKSDNATAQQLLRKAIEINARQSNYHALLAVTHLMDGLYGWSPSRDISFREALKSAESALALDEQDSQALRAIGLVYFFSKKHDTALSYYEKAVAANPNEAENRALLGAALGVAGDYEGARDQFEAAFQLSPRDAHIATWYNYLGVAAFIVGNDADAIEWSTKTVRANPTFPGGHRTLAAVNGVLGRLQEARTAREKLQELLPNLTIKHLRETLPYFKASKDLERYLDGLHKAGLPE